MKKFKYKVHYGNNGSVASHRTWKEAAAYIKYLLDSGYVVREIAKEQISE
jgi:hypothetical protein